MALDEQPITKHVTAKGVLIDLKATSVAGLVIRDCDNTVVFMVDRSGNMEFTGLLVESADEV